MCAFVRRRLTSHQAEAQPWRCPGGGRAQDSLGLRRRPLADCLPRALRLPGDGDALAMRRNSEIAKATTSRSHAVDCVVGAHKQTREKQPRSSIFTQNTASRLLKRFSYQITF